MKRAERIQAELVEIPLAGDGDAPRSSEFQALEFQLVGQIQPELDRPYIIKHLLNTASFAVLFGQSGAGKSNIAVSLAVAVSLGKPFFGHLTTRGAVLYLAGEGANGLTDRFWATCHENGLPTDIPVAVVRQAVVLDTEGIPDPKRVIETVFALESKTDEKCRLIVIDTLARSMAGDENSSQDMGRFVRSCEQIGSATGATILVIHHSGKDPTKGARGSSVLRGAVDTELLVEGLGNPRRFSATKQRDLPLSVAWQFELKSVVLGTDRDNETVTASVVAELGATQPQPRDLGKQQGRLLGELKRLQQEGGKPLIWSMRELRTIARGLQMHKSSAREAVNGLLGNKLLTSTAEGTRLTNIPEGRTGQNGTEWPNLSPAERDKRDEGSIDPVRSVPPEDAEPVK